MNGFRTAVVAGILFMFTIAALSQILTVKAVPKLIGSFGDMLASLFISSRG